jgi:Ca2+-binding RTX toxin-like protein
MSTRSTLICLALLGAAVVPGAAHASTTCSYDFIFHRATISMTAAGDAAAVSRSGNAIEVNSNPCGAATVDNTTAIVWDDNSVGGTTAGLDLVGGQLDPTTDLTYDAGPGTDTFNVWGSPQNDNIRIGSDGFDSYVNLDAAVFPDADVDLKSVEIADINGGEGNDVIDASAHGETGGLRFGGTLYEEGALGNDTLTAGSSTAYLSGGAGNDSLNAGGQGQLTVKPGTGDDVAVGEPLAIGVVDYSDAPAGVHVDLARTDRQDTGGAGSDQLSGFRQLYGSSFADVLAGTEGSDALQGGGGDDVLIGRGGADKLVGSSGNNVVSYAEPSPGVQAGVKVSLAIQGSVQDTGSEGNDTLSAISGLVGSPFADTLTGNAAANRIDGSGGPDTISAGDGADTVLLRDGISDHADCGGADDTVESDVQGLDVLSGCEQVAFAPFTPPPAQPGGDPQPQPGPGASDTTLTFRFTAKARQRLGKRGIVKGSLLCPDEACTGEVSSKLTIGRTARRAAHTTTPVAAGAAKVVKLRLGAGNVRRARAALHAGRKVTVRVTAVARDAAGNRRTVTRKVVLGA